MVHIIENDHGTIKADVTLSGIDLDELCLEAEVDGNHCKITRVFVRVSKEYGEQNFDKSKLNQQIMEWQGEILESLEKANEE